MDYSQLPNADSLYHYIVYGRPVGHFLTAVLSNDLFEAVGRADYRNLPRIPDYCMFIYNYSPSGCFGSAAKVQKWIEDRGMFGKGYGELTFEELFNGKAA